ncbi:MAG: GAF domain-containing protein [Desulfobulbaceae bacterium]|nr:GAF domain-containing protein [Desulfobulbaceae bacterium]
MTRSRDNAAILELLAKIESEISSFGEHFSAAEVKSLKEKITEVVAQNVREYAEEQVVRFDEFVRIGLALSAEKDVDHLFEMIVNEARHNCNADGGTLYIRNEKEDVLDFVIALNDTLQVWMGGSGDQISWPSVPLKKSDGTENHRNVSAHCVLVGKPVNIKDVYAAEGFDFDGTKQFDVSTGYRSRSMLLVPLRDHENEVIGVLQLLNAKDRQSDEVIPFRVEDEKMVMSLASQAAIALTKMRLVRDLENLLFSFLQVIGHAIDEKSPYTNGHINRVAELSEHLAVAVNDVADGPYGSEQISPVQLAEIRLAAWMHDVGKITTPEHIIDKGTKLETLSDRIEVIGHRIEILKRDAEIRHLREALRKAGVEDFSDAASAEIEALDSDFAFIGSVNNGCEFLADQALDRISALQAITLKLGDRQIPLLNVDEVENLSIRRGTLTSHEMGVIRNHVNVTNSMLARLPFPKKFSQVPAYAAMHHEKLDGSGYPQGLHGDNIPLPGRMLAVADIFEALTAADRPYKTGKKMSEAMRIMQSMVTDNHLDGDLCDLMVESGLAVEYALKFLSEGQLDDFEWKGKKYSFGNSHLSGTTNDNVGVKAGFSGKPCG